MNERELFEAAAKDAVKSAQQVAANASLTLAALNVKSCELTHPDPAMPSAHRIVSLRFDRPDQAQAFINALKKATGN